MADVGRPTEYSPEKLKLAQEYLIECESDNSNIPSVSRLAAKLGVHRDTLYEWASHEDKKDFSDTIKKIGAMQEADLIEKGLKGRYNPAMSIFLLKANSGMIETSRQELTGKDGKDLIPKPILGGQAENVPSDNSD